MVETITITTSVTAGTSTPLIVTTRSPKELLSKVGRYDIDTYVAESGDLWMRPSWQVAVKGFLTSEEARQYRAQQAQGSTPRQVAALEWVSQHLDDLQARFPGQWIGLVGEDVVATGATVQDLIEALRRRGSDGAFITQIPAGPVTWEFLF